MSLVQALLPEFDHEMQGTRSILQLVPDNLLEWKAHESLNSVGWVASHIVDTLSWMEVTVKETSFDVAPIGGEPHQSPVLKSAQKILVGFDQNLSTARELMAATTDDEMMVPWTLLQGGQELFTMPRIAVVKTFFVNHVVHHRAFLVAYLRMNGIECPGLYG